jgi:hypothetical protein
MKKQDVQKKAMLEALKKSLGIVAHACESVGIARKTHYEWLDSDPAYRAAVDDIGELQVDFVESALMKRIKEGDTTGIIFYMKTKGRKRGYSERIINEVQIKQLPDWAKEDPE